MTSAQDLQIQQIQSLQSEGGLLLQHDQNDELSDSPLAYVISTYEPMPAASVKNLLSSNFAGIDFYVETLRDTVADPRIFIITFPGVSFSNLSGSPFALSYYLENLDFIQTADADIETGFHPWKDLTLDERGEAKAAVVGCFSDTTTDPIPSDNGWALRQTTVDLAWENFGVTGNGVKLAQIDSGLANHAEFDGLIIDDTIGLNMYDSQKGASDPLEKRVFDQPGHGTAVASVIISQGGVTENDSTEPGKVSGVAQKVDYLPIRAIRSVLRLRQSKIAKAIHAAIDNDAHVISMSLGGLPSGALKAALDRARTENVITLAAAGNCVPFVVFPAAYHNCVAVSGTTYQKTPWRGASTGRQVDFSAPAEFVPHANRESEDDPQPYEDVARGQGTSFSVALSAGIAALWVEHFGREKLIASLAEGESLLDRFRYCVSLTAQPGVDWPPESLGAGIIDAEKLLRQDPFKPEVKQQNVTVAKDFSYAALFNTPKLPEGFDKFGPEITYLLLLAYRQSTEANPYVEIPPKSDELSEFIKLNPAIQNHFQTTNSVQTN